MRSASIVLAIILALTAPASAAERGLFVTVIEKPSVLSSREEIQKLVEFSKQYKITTLYVQIYRANQAWFPSKLSDTAPYKAALQSVGEDPFKLLIREAHKEGIEVHGWVNLLSLGQNENAPILKKFGPSIITRNLKPKKTLQDYRIDSQYFLEPGDPRLRRELAAIMKEIVAAYPEMDGIQFDYIRYPDANPHYGYTKINMSRFRQAKNVMTIDDQSLIWQDWKREQVTRLVRELTRTVRAINPRLTVSTTGCVSFSRAYLEAFQDWPRWINEDIVEYVTLMNYADEMPVYEKNIADAKKKARDFGRVGIGIGAYKFEKDPASLGRQLDACEASGTRECVLFYYSNLKSPSIRQALWTPPGGVQRSKNGKE